MGRFEPQEGMPYGKCSTCEEEFETKDLAYDHMSNTTPLNEDGEGKRSHSISVINAPREDRVKHEVSQIVDDSITDALNRLDGLVSTKELSFDEVRDALKSHWDFGDAWIEEYGVEEGEDDAE